MGPSEPLWCCPRDQPTLWNPPQLIYLEYFGQRTHHPSPKQTLLSKSFFSSDEYRNCGRKITSFSRFRQTFDLKSSFERPRRQGHQGTLTKVRLKDCDFVQMTHRLQGTVGLRGEGICSVYKFPIAHPLPVNFLSSLYPEIPCNPLYRAHSSSPTGSKYGISGFYSIF